METMCPSEVFELPVMPNAKFGPETEVFRAADSFPCSIMLKDVAEGSGIQIQVKTDRSDWKDYVEGDLIIGRSVLCRMAAPGVLVPSSVKIEVFHT